MGGPFKGIVLEDKVGPFKGIMQRYMWGGSLQSLLRICAA